MATSQGIRVPSDDSDVPSDDRNVPPDDREIPWDHRDVPSDDRDVGVRAWAVTAVEAELHRQVAQLEDRDDLFDVIVADALFPPGKLLRPVLCLLSAAAVGGDATELVPYAAGLEFLHVASLIHDDIVDQDPVRRGRVSAAEHHGISEALLAGDGIIALGIRSLLGPPDGAVPAARSVDAYRVVADTAEHMARAALKETEIRGDPNVSVADGLAIIRGKTAGVLRGACRCGAVLAGASAAWTDSLSLYGLRLGMAFQIRDDLLPYTSTEHLAGKQPVSDVANRQPTLPVLLAHAAADPGDRRLLTELFAGGDDSLAAHRELAALLERTGALREAAHLATSYAEQARDALADLPATESRDCLADLAMTAAERDH
ncbi:polyprenyl synthetase family protein [Actinomadura rudentiformis]|uniref:Polyprenyl synthetase family protein n=1 Tax=Actinomadura rudentiformis TaxID=359158 RepID=A0A6H9Z799_9ACTN|nr:polyprenyl synthetase family protein [Actinomadura rudentiformis]KAB2352226.1 polyprenyl synthetase family protein [Actinomadura rudentiformis]